MTFGERLRAARQSAHMTQKELAARVSAKHNSVSNWENDRNRPDADMIGRLCRVLPLQPNDFYEEDDAFRRQLSGVEFALFGELRRLNDDDKRDVLDFVRFKNAMREKRDHT